MLRNRYKGNEDVCHGRTTVTKYYVIIIPKFSKFSIDAGKVPMRLLLFRWRNLSRVNRPMTVGILPFKLLKLKSITSIRERGCHFVNYASFEMTEIVRFIVRIIVIFDSPNILKLTTEGGILPVKSLSPKTKRSL